VIWYKYKKHLLHAIKTLHNTFPPHQATQHQNADRHDHARSCRHIGYTKSFMKEVDVCLPVVPEGMLTYGKNKFAWKCKAIPVGLTHFYCHLVVVLPQKNLGFFNIGGRLVASWWNPTPKNIVSGPLVQPQWTAQKPDHLRPVPSLPGVGFIEQELDSQMWITAGPGSELKNFGTEAESKFEKVTLATSDPNCIDHCSKMCKQSFFGT